MSYYFIRPITKPAIVYAKDSVRNKNFLTALHFFFNKLRSKVYQLEKVKVLTKLTDSIFTSP